MFSLKRYGVDVFIEKVAKVRQIIEDALNKSELVWTHCWNKLRKVSIINKLGVCGGICALFQEAF